MANRSAPRGALAALLVWLASPSPALAGPPFLTDDPETVEHRHWEVYFASQVASSEDGWSGTSPHLEVNYGVVPDVQLHVILPLAWSVPTHAGARFGYGDTELGVKLRFVHESSDGPQVGTFPILLLPTGDASRGLGAGSASLFLPIWLQKSWGAFTTYGGGGYRLVEGPHTLNRWFVGWQAQLRLAPWVTVGVEVFAEFGEPNVVEGGFDLGAMLDVDDVQHVLLSVGGRYAGELRPQAYVAYQLTFGPR